MKTRNHKEEWLKYGKIWREKNPNKMYEYNHSEKNKERQARYRKNHREEIRKRNIEYNKRRIEKDTNARLLWLLRSRVNGAIKKCKGTKAYKTIELVGCSLDELRFHIEKQFSEEMNWENHGRVWEIDHINQVKYFDLTNPEEQKKCFHYTNLRPLNWLQNRKEQNRIMV